MTSNAEYIGKSHEKLTRDILNNVERQGDTITQLSHLDDTEQERVVIGGEKAATYIKEHTPFEITEAIEVGDKRKRDPDDDTDLLVLGGEEQEKNWSLKLTSDTCINVRNTLASVLCEDIFLQPIDEVLTEDEMDSYNEWTGKYADGECDGSEMAGVMTPIFAEKFSYAIEHADAELRQQLLPDIRLESNTVAVKVTSAGNFGGFASMERRALRKFKSGEGELSAYTTDNNRTSIFFNVDGENVFRIDMYGQYAGGRMDRIKTVYRVDFK